MASEADQSTQPNFPQQNDVELATNVEKTHQPVPAQPVPGVPGETVLPPTPGAEPAPEPAAEPEKTEET